ncbi:MAG: phage gp6-like head-tail connector protein [Eubacterium sp.]|nr:phage gp6-like head-tail connector protein [Candidatus Colimonas fimequi]
MTWTELLSASFDDVLASDNLKQVADYVKVELGDDDVALVSCVKAAVQYIISAVGAFPEDSHTAFILLCVLTQNFYDNRELMQLDVQQKKRIEYTYGSILLQLQLELEEVGEH